MVYIIPSELKGLRVKSGLTQAAAAQALGL